MRRSLFLLILFTAGIGGCGKSGSGPEVVKAPAHSGDVWEIDRAAGRAAMPGAVLAYANGLHVMVVDGKEVFAGMNALRRRIEAQRRTRDQTRGRPRGATRARRRGEDGPAVLDRRIYSAAQKEASKAKLI